MQQHSIGVFLYCRFAPVLLSQGFAVCIAPISEKSMNVIAENKTLALIDEKEMTSKKYIISHADDPCRTAAVLKTSWENSQECGSGQVGGCS